MNINDRRVRKTKKALIEALSSLMMKKELHNITIKELTNTADIHRATFYSHYKDIYDMYKKVEDSVINEIDNILVINQTNSYEDIYKSIVDYVYNNPMICRMFLSKNSSIKFKNRICEVIEKNYLNIWLYEDGKTEITTEMEYIAKYHIQGCISIICHWIENDFSYPKHLIIELLRKVDINIEKINL